LLQVLLHATIGKQHGNFDLESVSKRLADKLIYRHPHVFAEKDPSIQAEQVETNWEMLKQKQKKQTYEIDETYLKFPSLFSADKIGKKTNKLGFDWKNATQVMTKVDEELNELKSAIKENDLKNTHIEFGDLLFTMAQLGRHLKLDPEMSLRDANSKFVRRLKFMEDAIKADGLVLSELKLDELDKYWDKVKTDEKNIKT